jgi:hypothetical protein
LKINYIENNVEEVVVHEGELDAIYGNKVLQDLSDSE